VALLDVNVLIAMFDPFHVHYEAAHAWFRGLEAAKWATCPIVTNGCVRVMSQPGFKRTPLKPTDVTTMLGRLHDPNHEFWPDSISILDDTLFDLSQIQSAKHLTDVYLLGLAVRRGGHLVTFDRSIPLRAVKGAKPAHLKVLGGTAAR
jgi:toxin-antitoxin system PIN domain toxin